MVERSCGGEVMWCRGHVVGRSCGGEVMWCRGQQRPAFCLLQVLLHGGQVDRRRPGTVPDGSVRQERHGHARDAARARLLPRAESPGQGRVGRDPAAERQSRYVVYQSTGTSGW